MNENLRERGETTCMAQRDYPKTMSRTKHSRPTSNPRIPLVEMRLAHAAEELPGQRILATTVGYAPAAHRLAAERFDAHVVCWILEACQAARAANCEGASSRIEIRCQADCPEFPCDLALVPLYMNGTAELARDVLENVYCQLEVGGRLVVAIDNPRDKWVRQVVRGFSKSIKCMEFTDALVYILVKQKPVKKLKDHRCQLAFRDAGKLIRLVTRPGVFSHRQLDNGARQLMDAVDASPSGRVLDLGCGSGAAALAVASRDPTTEVVALDSHARAVECTTHGAELNQLTNVSTVLACAEFWTPDRKFDLVLANPPYYGNDRLAEIFMTVARRALRPSGQVVAVTKHPDWYREHLSRWFINCRVIPSKRYFIATGQVA